MNSSETWCPGLLCLLRDTEMSGVYRLGNLVTLRSQTAKPLYSFRQTGDSLHQQRHPQPGLGKYFHILSMIQWMKRIMKTKKANNITKILKTKLQLVLLSKGRPKIVSSNKELKQEHDIECPVYNWKSPIIPRANKTTTWREKDIGLMLTLKQIKDFEGIHPKNSAMNHKFFLKN